MFWHRKRRVRDAKSDIILINCPTWGATQPPLGIAYLCEALRNAGFGVRVFDFNIQLLKCLLEKDLGWVWTKATRSKLRREEEAELIFREGREQVDAMLAEIIEDGAPVIGFSLISERSWISSLLLAQRIKQEDRSRYIIFGGNAGNEMKRHIDQKGFLAIYKKWHKLQLKVVDLIVEGEGEVILPEILRVLQRGEDPVRANLGELSRSGKTPIIKAAEIRNLDSIAFPTYRDFDLDDYRDYFATQKLLPEGSRQLQFLFSRGCINNCSFCNEKLYTGRYRCRSAENAIEEMKYHVTHHGATHFEFSDLILNGNLKRLLQLCDRIIEEQLDIKWTGLLWISKKLTRPVLEKMFRSGFTAVHLGLESGSTPVLDLMHKGYDAETAERVIRDAKAVGMWISVNIIVGHPGETDAYFEETLDFMRRNRPYIDAVLNLSTCEIDKGMDLLRYPERYGLTSLEGDRWEDTAGNNFDVRLEKAERFRQMAREIDLPIYIDNTGMTW
jgi:radical SAM superfamily enzyme YgiQ (UPF0313 family)